MIGRTSKAFKEACNDIIFTFSHVSLVIKFECVRNQEGNIKVKKWKQVKKLNVHIWEYYKEAMISRNV